MDLREARESTQGFQDLLEGEEIRVLATPATTLHTCSFLPFLPRAKSCRTVPEEKDYGKERYPAIWEDKRKGSELMEQTRLKGGDGF